MIQHYKQLACTLLILKCRIPGVGFYMILYNFSLILFCVNDKIKSIYLRDEMKNYTHERNFSPLNDTS